jgi:hypothetical protein
MTQHLRPRPIPVGRDVAGVYVLLRHDRRRFKIGWARSPLHRARQLREYRRGELDLKASRTIWLPNRQRAEQVERSAHKSLAPYRVDAGHREDGSQEWYAGHAQDSALRLLSQMPLEPDSSATARLLPIAEPPAPADAVCIETGPQDAWWRLEDLLGRMALHCAITVHDLEPGLTPVVSVHGLRRMTDAAALELRSAAMDCDSYQCWRDGRPLNFVKTVDWLDGDLILHFTSMKVLERWEQGPELVWQVRGFLARLARSARLKRLT